MGLETFGDYREMFNRVDLDFVIVATPTASHAEAVREAIRQNLHVFVEKPLARNGREANEILVMLEGKNLVNQVGYVVRFNEVFTGVRRLLRLGTIGEPLSFKMEMYGPTVLKNVKHGWRSKKAKGGGCLHDFCSHGIDLINYLLGPPKEAVGTVLKRIYSTDVEDAVYSILLYENDLSGILAVNWSDPSYRKPSYRMEILGAGGKIIADLHAYKVFLKEQPTNGEFTKGWNVRHITDFAKPVRFYVRGNEFTRQLDYFVERVLGRTRVEMCSFADAAVTDEIIDKLIDASCRGGRRDG
jgi:predicted dehydrogenase